MTTPNVRCTCTGTCHPEPKPEPPPDDSERIRKLTDHIGRGTYSFAGSYRDHDEIREYQARTGLPF